MTHHLTMVLDRMLDALIGPPRPVGFRKVAKWLTCRITDRPTTGYYIRKSRVTDRYRFVTSRAACKRDWEATPVLLPTIRANRKSGVGTPRRVSKNPFFPVPSEKNVISRVHAALEICNTCPMLEPCRTITMDLPPVSGGIVQGGIVWVSKVGEFRNLVKEWNRKAPQALRIPTKGRKAWTVKRHVTDLQWDEMMADLTNSLEMRASRLSIEGGVLEAYESQANWDEAVERHG